MWFDVRRFGLPKALASRCSQPSKSIAALPAAWRAKNHGFGTVVVFDIGQPERD